MSFRNFVLMDKINFKPNLVLEKSTAADNGEQTKTLHSNLLILIKNSNGAEKKQYHLALSLVCKYLLR